MLTLRAAAKINLSLEVLARRDDGYHGIRSVMVPLELADEITVEPAARFSFECDVPELQGESNLCVRAFRALDDLAPFRISLHKRIPSQAGLGGGSSDAAAILRAAMDGWFGAIGPRDWLGIARSLGSDVPFFLSGTAALVEGTGERVTPAGALPDWHALIVKPPACISTAQAYAALDRRERPARKRNESVSIAVLEALQRADFATVERLMQNDFHDWAASHEPQIAAAILALREAGAGNVLLAGSGSCVFTLAPERQRIDALCEQASLPKSYRRYTTRFAKALQWRR